MLENNQQTDKKVIKSRDSPHVDKTLSGKWKGFTFLRKNFILLRPGRWLAIVKPHSRGHE